MRCEEITVPRPGAPPQAAFLALPEGDPRGGVLVIHEIWGLNADIRRVARRFAAEGYVALAVDLFSGDGSRARCMLRVLGGMQKDMLDNPGLDDLKAAIAVLGAVPGVDPERVGVIGFCMGGGYALALACVERRVAAVHSFYGPGTPPEGSFGAGCAVAASIPGLDWTRFTEAKLRRALAQSGAPHDVKRYPFALHSFMAEGTPMHHAEAAADAWARTFQWFGRWVAGEGGGPPSLTASAG